MQEKSRFFLKSVFIFPVFASLIVALSALRLMKIYEAFQLPILNFVEFSEIVIYIFNFMTELIRFTPYAIVLIQIYYWMQLKSYLSINILIALVMSCSVLAWWLNLHKYTELIFLFVNVSVCIGLLALVYLSLEEFDKLYTGLIVEIAICIFLYFFTLTVSKKHVYLMKETNIFKGVSFVPSGRDSLKVDSSNFYIGNTKNYIFFYHRDKDSTEIFRINEIRDFRSKPFLDLRER